MDKLSCAKFKFTDRVECEIKINEIEVQRTFAFNLQNNHLRLADGYVNYMEENNLNDFQCRKAN